MPLTKSGVSELAIREWLQSKPAPALEQASDILAIPFVGTDYHAIPIGTYFDIRRGARAVTPDIRASYQLSKERIHRLDEFTLVAFEYAKGIEPSSRYKDKQLASVFYWDY